MDWFCCGQSRHQLVSRRRWIFRDIELKLFTVYRVRKKNGSHSLFSDIMLILCTECSSYTFPVRLYSRSLDPTCKVILPVACQCTDKQGRWIFFISVQGGHASGTCSWLQKYFLDVHKLFCERELYDRKGLRRHQKTLNCQCRPSCKTPFRSSKW